MARLPIATRYEIQERNGPGGRLVLGHVTDAGLCRIVISGYDGPALPAGLSDAVIEPASGGEGRRDPWCLRTREGEFHFRARAVDVIEERAELYEPLHRSFALSRADRLAVRVLLWMLRLPGGARLLRRWHAGRSP